MLLPELLCAPALLWCEPDPKELPLRAPDPKELPLRALDPKELPLRALDPKELPLRAPDPKELLPLVVEDERPGVNVLRGVEFEPLLKLLGLVAVTRVLLLLPKRLLSKPDGRCVPLFTPLPKVRFPLFW